MKHKTQCPLVIALWIVVLSAALAGALLLASCGADPQPAPANLAGPLSTPAPAEPAGISHFTNLYAEDLTATDDLTVGDDATVTGDLTVGGDQTLTGALSAADLTATDDLTVGDDATVTGDLTLGGAATITGALSAADLTATDDLTVGDDATITGDLTLGGAATITGTTTLNDEVRITLGTPVLSNHGVDITMNTDHSVGSKYGLYLESNADPSGGTSTQVRGLYNKVTYGSREMSAGIGLFNGVYGDDGNTNPMGTIYGAYNYCDAEDSDVTNAYTQYNAMSAVDAGSIGSSYGLYIAPSTVGTGTITSEYGIYMGSIDNASNNFSIYSEGGRGYHAGPWHAGLDVTAITTDTTIADTDTAGTYTNQGATGSLTITLPEAAADLNYCFYTFAAQEIAIDPATGDQIHHLTNAAGDTITNSTAGDSICLLAVDATYWIPLQEEGTWADGN